MGETVVDDAPPSKTAPSAPASQSSALAPGHSVPAEAEHALVGDGELPSEASEVSALGRASEPGARLKFVASLASVTPHQHTQWQILLMWSHMKGPCD